MSASRLARQLARLKIELALDEGSHVLRVRMAIAARQLAHLVHDPALEPLPALLARLARGEITTDQAGAAISRDPALAGQVARALDLNGSQLGDVQIGTVAGGSVYNIYYGGHRHE